MPQLTKEQQQQKIRQQVLAGLTHFQKHPEQFIAQVFGDKLFPYQLSIIEAIRDHDKVSVASCHGIGKSWISSRAALWFLITHPHSIVLTTAPTWRQVKDVLWKEIGSAVAASPVRDLPGELLQCRYNIAADWFAVGLSTDDPDRFQGYHAEHVLIIVDESSGVSAEIFEAIEGIGSTGHVRILELGNPTDPTGHFANTFKNQFYQHFSISCFDTPNFKNIPTIEALLNSTEEERTSGVVFPKLIVPQWVYERALEWGIETPMFVARCLGEFPKEGEDTLIPLRNALKAVESTELGDSTVEVLGVDVAQFGSDKTVLVYRKGNKVESIVRYAKTDIVDTEGRIAEFCRLHPYAKVNVDATGVGAGIAGHLTMFGDRVRSVMVGGGSSKPEEFVNLRAEYYANLALRFEQGEIIIPDDDPLISELTSIKYKITLKGQRQIESKDDMKKRGLHSPDSADALMLAFAPAPSSTSFIDYFSSITQPVIP